MKKVNKIKTLIRQIVREEVAMAIQEVITEMKQPPQQVSQPKPKKKIVEKKTFTKNKVLNDILNETVDAGEYETMGGGTYDSSKVSELLGKSYGGLMDSGTEVNADAMIASMGTDPNKVDDSVKNIFTKDYRSLMKAIDNKRG